MTEQGLTHEEAARRLGVYGPNVLADKKNHVLGEFLRQFTNPLILILLFACLISLCLGQHVNAMLILLMVVLSGVVDFFQTYKAQKAVEKLQHRVSLTATVIRDGKQEEVHATQIVPGDLLVLSTGDIISADARLVFSRNLLINEAVLTGESMPAEKKVGNGTNGMVFNGTHVVGGEAQAAVTATANKTQFGKLAADLSQKRPATEFEKSMNSLGFLLAKLTFVLVIFVFFINTLLRADVLNSFLFALALAVGLTPELLPVIMTVNLSRGALKMSKKGVIIKDLSAIQTFGQMDLLCTDKTGTLTEGRIALKSWENVEGKQDENLFKLGFLSAFYQTGIKGPMEKAIIDFSKSDISGFEKVEEIPFDFDRKRLSVIVKHKGKNQLITKGAPEGIFPHCTKYFAKENNSFTGLRREKIIRRFKFLSSEGYRVLAVAYKPIEDKKNYTQRDESDLVFLGFMVFADPPKLTAREAIANLEKQGVSVKILTGDSDLVTKKICEELNIPVEGVILGSDLETSSEAKFSEQINHATIFARTTPDQKEKIILLARKLGRVVGYLGDGINDAPSLQAADVGISVDNAVDVARESADLILLRKDLQVLSYGITEGRKTYANILKYIMMATSSNFGNMASLAGASLFLAFLPMLPVQILLNNLLYDFSQLLIPADRVDQEYLTKPKKWDPEFVKHFMFSFGPISSFFDFATFFTMMLVFKASAPLFQTGWFIESLTTQTLIILAIRTRVVPFWQSRPSRWLMASCLGVVALAWALPFTALGPVFGFARPPLAFFLILLLMVGIYFFLVEQMKRWFWKKYEML